MVKPIDKNTSASEISDFGESVRREVKRIDNKLDERSKRRIRKALKGK
jgi:hypothetical protein